MTPNFFTQGGKVGKTGRENTYLHGTHYHGFYPKNCQTHLGRISIQGQYFLVQSHAAQKYKEGKLIS